MEQIGFAGFPNGLGNIQHCLMRGQILGLHILHDTKNHPDCTDDQSEIKNGQPGKGTTQKADLRQIRQFDVRLTGKCCASHEQKHQKAQ